MTWHLHPDAIALVIVLLGLYILGVQWAGDRLQPRARPTRAQVILYVSGVAVLYIGAGSPLHDISEQYLLSAHMTQHMLFTLVAPPLLLLGLPDWLLRPLIQRRVVRRIAFEITRAFPAIIIFNAVVLVTHVPYVADVALRNHTFHFGVHVALVVTALLMWWPIFSPLPELPRLTPFPQLIYLFIQSLLPAVIASFLTLGHSVIYGFYAEVPVRYWGLSAHDDQVVAGLIMKLVGGAIIWGIMTAIFFRWFNSAEKQAAPATPAPVRWDEVEEELERMGLVKR